MAATAYVNALFEIVESVPGPLDLAANPQTRHRIVGCHGEFDATTSVPVAGAWSDTRTLAAGADTLDLTALSRAGDLAAVDATGLKLQGVKVFCPSTNTEDVLIATGATNGYTIGTLRIPPGGYQLLWFAEGLEDVASGAKTLDVSSDDADAGYLIIAAFG